MWTMPGVRLAVAMAVGLAISALLTAAALIQPRYSELLTDEGPIVLQDAQGQAIGAIAAHPTPGGTPHAIETADLTPEPDTIGSYSEQAEFFARQDSLAAWAVWAEQQDVPIIDGFGTIRPAALTAARGLPFEFWMQMAVGFTVFMISAWIWAMQPRALPNMLFGIAGAGLWIAAATAAIYSTRWLALPSALFLPLANINGFGAATYGAAMICLFLVYPVRLAGNWLLLAVAAFFTGWYVLGLFDRLGAPSNEVPLLTATEMLLILLLVVAQFFRSRKDPLQRAAIRWVGVSTLIGSGLFISLAVLPLVIGRAPLIDQSYAFAFFLIVHLGVAFGLRRGALFQSEQWAINLLRAASFGFLLVLVDVVLIALLGSIGSAAVLTCLLLLPFFYLPWRSFMQRWLTGNTSAEHLLEAAAHIALIEDSGQRAADWQGLLTRTFSPLQITPVPPSASSEGKVAIIQDGVGLQIPATMGCPALEMHYKANGTRLFQARDRQLSERLVGLVGSLRQEYDAFKQGEASERSRISRDLHDDLSARLMSGLALDDIGQLKAVLRSSLAEVRAIVSAEEGGPGRVADVLADSRAEAAERLEAAGMSLNWPILDAPGWLGPAQQKSLSSVLREIVTNSIRHSGGTLLSVQARVEGGRLYVVADDDGDRFDGTLRQGNGIRNMGARMAAIGGYFDCAGRIGAGFRISFNLPLAR
ncbi:sensory histidine kinase UhpB [Croceibacterium atlanticum]|uniref:Sensory histidine kinase UhpB n=2 Tax=Croceibacterium atlanticum TaxID=1267766 RepID=A0A0F7KR13_9SPHN|nr:sensory histidine kinase UhpB [Croceibacterium atlanticum]